MPTETRIKPALIAPLVILLTFTFAGAATALGKGYKSKDKHTYRKGYMARLGWGEMESSRSIIHQDAKTRDPRTRVSGKKVFPEGCPAWKTLTAAPAFEAGKEERSIDHLYFKKIVAENRAGIYLVAVRDKDEYDKGGFKTAINSLAEDLELKKTTPPSDNPIVFYHWNRGSRW